ncbi:hypothetical protein FOXYS1_5644 [Fusarium oxysporum]|uniref:Uncharacterized protein n=1 Tax=Fusarium oxysporum TaxID=5507 RepID=A0A8H5AEE5_FUSOX|nr:hypothetical protein FOXYS1_5644 [Fusarium oxysporum]
MARLKSSSKSRKPGLVSRPQQLLSPSCIMLNRLTRQDASARRTNISTWSPDFPDLNADGLEYLDLTNDAFDSFDSLSFYSDAKLWREDYASRPNLVASSGRKRKSSEISEEEFSVLGDGTYSPTPSPGNRSGTRRTCDGFKNYLLIEIPPISEENEDDIPSPSRYVHSPLAHEQSPRKALPVIDTQPHSKGATSPLKESAVSSEASKPVHQTSSLPPRMEDGRDEPFSPEFDREYLTPPSHNSSIAILKVSTNKPAQICTHAAPTTVSTVHPDIALPSQRHVTPGITSPRVRAIASNSSQTAKATLKDSFNELPSNPFPESSQTLFLLNQLSSQPSTLTKWSEFNYNVLTDIRTREARFPGFTLRFTTHPLNELVDEPYKILHPNGKQTTMLRFDGYTSQMYDTSDIELTDDQLIVRHSDGTKIHFDC